MAAHHALQLSAEKRLSAGLNFLAAYTWGHSIDNVPTAFGGGADGPVPQDNRNRHADRGNSPFDIRHRFTYSWNYRLPFGKGQRLLDRGGAADFALAFPQSRIATRATIASGPWLKRAK